MNLTISDENSQFFRQIYTILGIQSISKSELIYTISYRLNLPYKPTTLVKKIRDAVKEKILIEENKILQLNENDLKEIRQEQKNYESSLKKLQQISWNRIEGSEDPWMSIAEEKSKKLDKKSLTLNAIVRKLISKETLKEGYDIPASKFHIQLENKILSGTIDDPDEKELKFEIDVQNKTIIHNCKDFVDSLSKKMICKHFYRIFMYVKKKDIVLAKNLLLSLYEKKQEWKFKEQ